MPSKTQLYRTVIAKYEETYGTLPDTGDKPLLINITGPLRNDLYKNNQIYDKYMVLAAMGFALIFVPTIITLILMCSICVMYFKIDVDYSNVFDGEFIDIEGRMIGVVKVN